MPKYSEDNFPRIAELAQGFKDVARICAPGQIAIAWLLAQGLEIFPLPGTKSTQRMDEHAKSALLELPDKMVCKIFESWLSALTSLTVVTLIRKFAAILVSMKLRAERRFRMVNITFGETPAL